MRINACVRSGRVAANIMAGGPAVARTPNDGLSEAGGVHDGLDLGRSIIQRANLRDRVRQPDPGLVVDHDATERGEPVVEGIVLRGWACREQLDVADHKDRRRPARLARRRTPDTPGSDRHTCAYNVSATALSVRLPGASRTVSISRRPGRAHWRARQRPGRAERRARVQHAARPGDRVRARVRRPRRSGA